MEVRQASPADLSRVSEILVEASLWLIDEGMALWDPGELSPASLSNDVSAGLYFLAWDGPRTVGAMRLSDSDPLVWPAARLGEALYLHRLVVRRAAAGGETSSTLVHGALCIARSRGATYLRLDCEAARRPLRHLYEGFGFRLHSEHSAGPHVLARYERAVSAEREEKRP